MSENIYERQRGSLLPITLSGMIHDNDLSRGTLFYAINRLRYAMPCYTMLRHGMLRYVMIHSTTDIYGTWHDIFYHQCIWYVETKHPIVRLTGL